MPATKIDFNELLTQLKETHTALRGQIESIFSVMENASAQMMAELAGLEQAISSLEEHLAKPTALERKVIVALKDYFYNLIQSRGSVDVDFYQEHLKLLDDSFVWFAIHYLAAKGEYPISNFSQTPLAYAAVQEAWTILDWKKVEAHLEAEVKEFRRVAQVEIDRPAK